MIDTADPNYLPWVQDRLFTLDARQDSTSNTEPDGVFNYACSVMFYGMIFREFTDCIREGDADREEICWKILLMLFRVKFKGKCHRVKYAHTAFKYLAQVKAILSPQMAHKLKWGRYFNSSGGKGKNIPCDLRIEHEVRALKSRFDSLGKNLTPENAQKIATSQGNLSAIVSNFDVHVKPPIQTTGHTKLSSELDIDIMVNDLLVADVFSYQSKRFHSVFKGLPGSPISQLDIPNTLHWMKTLVKKFSSSKDLFSSSSCIDSDDDDSDIDDD